MPSPIYETGAANAYEIGGFDGGHGMTLNCNASGPDRIAIAVAEMVTAGGATANSTASYGGVAMTKLGVIWYGNANFQLFYLLNPLPGARSVGITWNGIGATFPTKQVSGAVAVYNNVSDIAGFVKSPDQTSGTASTVTVPDTVPGELVVSAHARGQNPAYTAYTGTIRHTVATTFARILIGDAPALGGAQVMTATQTNDSYGAFGLRLLPTSGGQFFAMF